jgi:hypothetical protein
MTESVFKPKERRSRIYLNITLSPEDLAKRKAEHEIFAQRCRELFDRVRPQIIDTYYGWYIAVEPESGDYFIDENIEIAHNRALQKYPHNRHCVFCLNETGATGSI